MNSYLDCRDNWVENKATFTKSLNKALAFKPIIIKGLLQNSHTRVLLDVDGGLAVKIMVAMLEELILKIAMLLSHL